MNSKLNLYFVSVNPLIRKSTTIKTTLNFKKIFRVLVWLIPIGVIGNVTFSLLKTESSVIPLFHQLSYPYLVLAAFLTLFPWLPDALKVMLWTRFLKHPLSYKDSLTIVIGSELGSAVSPTAIGGGYVKLGMLIQKGFPAGTAASLMVLGSLEMGLFFGLAIPVSFAFSKAYELPILVQITNRFLSRAPSLTPILIVILCFGVMGAILFVQPIRYRLGKFRWIKQLQDKMKTFWCDFILIYRLVIQRGKWRLGLTLLLTAIQWICKYMVICALLACFNIPVHPVLFFLFQWAVFSLGVLIPTPGGTVGVEAAFYFVFSAVLPENMAGLVTALWRFFTYYFLLIMDCLLFSMLHLNIHRRNVHQIKRYLGLLTEI